MRSLHGCSSSNRAKAGHEALVRAVRLRQAAHSSFIALLIVHRRLSWSLVEGLSIRHQRESPTSAMSGGEVFPSKLKAKRSTSRATSGPVEISSCLTVGRKEVC